MDAEVRVRVEVVVLAGHLVELRTLRRVELLERHPVVASDVPLSETAFEPFSSIVRS